MFGSLTTFPGGLFEQFDRLQRELDQGFGLWRGPVSIRAVAQGSFPPINVGVTPEAVEIYAFVPGIDPKSLDISIQNNLLTLTGERQAEMPQASDTVNIYLRERFYGRFRRVLSLTEDVDPQRVEARYRDGVLRITAPKQAAAKARQIEVK
jgi:HSP20 family protein